MGVLWKNIINPRFPTANKSICLSLGLSRDAITFGTIYKFKGMENSCIIITDIGGYN
jgi:hypothetical protein